MDTDIPYGEVDMHEFFEYLHVEESDFVAKLFRAFDFDETSTEISPKLGECRESPSKSRPFNPHPPPMTAV